MALGWRWETTVGSSQIRRFLGSSLHVQSGALEKNSLKDGRPEVGALNRKGEPSYELDDADERTFATDFLTERALVEFIGQKEYRPFFLMLSFPIHMAPTAFVSPMTRSLMM